MEKVSEPAPNKGKDKFIPNEYKVGGIFAESLIQRS